MRRALAALQVQATITRGSMALMDNPITASRIAAVKRKADELHLSLLAWEPPATLAAAVSLSPPARPPAASLAGVPSGESASPVGAGTGGSGSEVWEGLQQEQEVVVGLSQVVAEGMLVGV